MHTHSQFKKLVFAGGLFVLLLALSGCATLTPQTSQNQATLEEAGVDPELARKAAYGKNLEIEDVTKLHAQGATKELILKIIDHSDSVFRLNTEEITRLQTAGVETEIIDAMLATPQENDTRFRPTYPAYHHLRGYPYYPHRSYRYGYHHYGYHRYRCY
jgi:tRNA splicing endonuclease